MCVCMHACACVCVCVSEFVCVRACVCAHVHVKVLIIKIVFQLSKIFSPGHWVIIHVVGHSKSDTQTSVEGGLGIRLAVF